MCASACSQRMRRRRHGASLFDSPSPSAATSSIAASKNTAMASLCAIVTAAMTATRHASRPIDRAVRSSRAPLNQTRMCGGKTAHSGRVQRWRRASAFKHSAARGPRTASRAPRSNSAKIKTDHGCARRKAVRGSTLWHHADRGSTAGELRVLAPAQLWWGQPMAMNVHTAGCTSR